MDTIQDPNRKKKQSELGLEKQSRAKHTVDSKKVEVGENEIELKGEILKMSEDLIDLPEINYEDPEIKKWLKEEDAAFQKRHSNLTYEEADKMIKKRIAKLIAKL